MSLPEAKRNRIIEYIIDRIGRSEKIMDIDTARIANEYGVTIQTIYRYLKKLEEDGRIIRTPKGRGYIYELPEVTDRFKLLIDDCSEDVAWNKYVQDFIGDVPECANHILYYIFTEMVNNAIDHSEGTEIYISIKKNEFRTEFMIIDNGIGIFNKIAAALNLPEKRFAILELAKGKFTTDPESHTGEGIFFSSKAADMFIINSDDLSFASNIAYSTAPEIVSEYMVWDFPLDSGGTNVLFNVHHGHSRPLKEVFDEYAGIPDEYGFDKTAVPVRLVEFGNDNPLFISRSQAKRLLARFEDFNNIILDFSGVDSIGQGFADEVFRVFPARHPGSKLTPVNCSDNVQQMIKRVSK